MEGVVGHRTCRRNKSQRETLLSKKELRGAFSARHAKRAGKVIAVGATAAVVAGLVVSSAGVSSAAGRDPNFIGLHPTTTPFTGMGTMKPSGWTTQIMCIDQSLDHPSVKTTPYTITDPWHAYLFKKYGQTTNNDQAYALAWLIKADQTGHTGLDGYKSLVNNSWNLLQKPSDGEAGSAFTYYNATQGAAHKTAVNNFVASMKADANRNAGPYTVTIDATSTNGGVSGTVSVKVVGAAGLPVAGIPVTMTLGGGTGAKFQGNGSTTYTITSSSSAQTFGWNGVYRGTVTASAVTGPVVNGLTIYPPQAAGYQRMVGGTSTKTVSGSDPTPVPVGFHPKVTTVTSSTEVAAGTSISDTLTITGGAPGSTLYWHDTLYGAFGTKPATATNPPAGAPTVGSMFTGSVVLNSSGAATVKTGNKLLPAGGYYTWQAELMAGGMNYGYKDAFAAATETTLATEVTTPVIGTSATDADGADGTKGDNTLYFNGGNVTDVVAYQNLTPGIEYTISGELMNQADGSGTGIVASTTFTPTAASGTVNVQFVVPTGYAGKTLVIFEALVGANGDKADHKDIDDADQMVTVAAAPSISTTATDKADGDHNLVYKGGTVTDEVAYKGFVVGATYTISGELMDKADGSGSGIVGSTTFTPTTADGTVNIEFVVPTGHAGKTFVVFETAKDADGDIVAEHKDITDVAQTIVVAVGPSIGTTATDKADGDKVIDFRGGTVTDVVAYKNLTPGTEYTLDGELMNKADGKATGIKASTTFVAADADGTVDLDFVVPAGYGGSTFVVFENLSDADGAVAAHADITDAAQTVTVEQTPSIKTSATDKSDGDKVITTLGGTITDVVSYTNLKPGTEYTVSGELMNKADGKGTGITASKRFTPTAANGTVSLDFTVPRDFGVARVVVFEKVTDSVGTVAVHTDINDVAQSVDTLKPSLGTKATDKADGDQTLPSTGGTINDHVSYKSLIPGKTYTMSGELMDKSTGKATGVKATKVFTPTKADGTVDLTFTVPAGYGGKSLVAFEKATDSVGTVAVHTDINDAAQTVFVESSVGGVDSGTPGEGSGPNSGLVGGGIAAGILAGGLLLVSRRRRDDAA